MNETQVLVVVSRDFESLDKIAKDQFAALALAKSAYHEKALVFGKTLLEIRNHPGVKKNFINFNAYCQHTFKFPDQYAYDLFDLVKMDGEKFIEDAYFKVQPDERRAKEELESAGEFATTKKLEELTDMYKVERIREEEADHKPPERPPVERDLEHERVIMSRLAHKILTMCDGQPFRNEVAAALDVVIRVVEASMAKV